jgi:uncharacterized membrane protein
MANNALPQELQDLDAGAIPPLSLWGRILMFSAPVVLFWAISLSIYLAFGWTHFSFFFANAAGNFVGAGKLVILSGALPDAPIGVWGLAALVIYSDIAVSMMLLAVMNLLYRLPLVGKPFSKTCITGGRILRKHPWVRRAAFWGVALYIALPFQGTGAVLGTTIARMTGLSRGATVAAVTLGSGIGCAAVAWLVNLNRNHLAALAEEPLLGVLFAVLLLGVMFLIGKRLTGDDRGQ